MTLLKMFPLVSLFCSSCQTHRGDPKNASNPEQNNFFWSSESNYLSIAENSSIDVLSYSIDLTYAGENAPTVDVIAELKIKLRENSSNIQLHCEKSFMTIKHVNVDSQTVDYTVLSKPQKPDSHLTDGTLNVNLNGIRMKDSVVTLTIAYALDIWKAGEKGIGFGMQGLHSHDAQFTASDRRLQVWNWPYYARFWLPSNDHPSQRGRFSFVFHIPPTMTALASGHLVEGDETSGSGLDSNGLKVFKWEESTPITPYLANMIIGKFIHKSDLICFNEPKSESDLDKMVDCKAAEHKIPFAFYAPASSTKLESSWQELQKVKGALAFFSNTMGMYDFEKLYLEEGGDVATLEYASLIRILEFRMAVHELAHHWWGNGVQIQNWGDLWINEGLATYLQGLYDEFLSGKNSFRDWCPPIDFGKEGLNFDTFDPLFILDNKRLEGLTVYCRSASAFEELRNHAAKAARVENSPRASMLLFLRILHTVYQTHRLTSVSTITFLKTLEEASLKEVLALQPSSGGAFSSEYSQWRGKFFKFGPEVELGKGNSLPPGDHSGEL